MLASCPPTGKCMVPKKFDNKHSLKKETIIEMVQTRAWVMTINELK